jgi:hypothetical protein
MPREIFGVSSIAFLAASAFRWLIDALQVLETQARGDFSARGRPALLGNVGFDEAQHEILLRTECAWHGCDSSGSRCPGW